MSAMTHDPSLHSGTDSELDRLIEELTRRVQAGEAVDLEAFAREHPGYTEPLRRLLPALELLADLGQSVPAENPRGDMVRPEPIAGLGELGDFRLVREIGRGGMGIVYEAEQISLRRRVALKVLPFAATLDARQIQRFRVEAQAAACLHHPHIVPVHGVGCDRGVHYYAMQLIEGQSLAAMIAELRRLDGLDPPDGTAQGLAGVSTSDLAARLLSGPAPDQPVGAGSDAPTVELPAGASQPVAPTPRASRTRRDRTATSGSSTRNRNYVRNAARLALEAAEALDHAHANGILHRDIKPANLLLDAQGRLWVTDFGLAQVRGDDRLTLSGDVLGTLRYMSPEQALGRRVVIDGRTDVYSLGVTLYESLALHPAVDGRDRAEILHKIADQEPPSLRTVNPAVPADLETIVLKATAKDPAGRYATAQELADDLRNFLEDRPIRARRPGLLDRAAKWARRHQSVLMTAAVVLVLGMAASTWEAIRATNAEGLARARLGEVTKERNRADSARQDADRRATEAREVVDFLINDMIGAAAPSRALGTIPTVDKVLAKADQNVAKKFADRPLIEASIHHALGKAYEELGQYEKAEQHAARAVELRLPRLGPEHAETIAAQNALGWALLRRGKSEEAGALLTKVLDTARRALGSDQRETLAAMNGLAAALMDTDRRDQARSLREELLSAKTRLLGPEHPETLSAMNNLATQWVVAGHLAKARPLFEQALAVGLRDRPDHPSTLTTMGNLVRVYTNLEDHDRAAEMWRRLMEGRLHVFGLAHPFTQQAIADYSLQSVIRRADWDESRKVLGPILDRARRELGADAKLTVALTSWLADLLSLLGRSDKAVAMLDALPETREALEAREGSARFLYTCNHREAALSQFERVEALRARLVPAEDRFGVASRTRLALVLRDRGRLAEARSLLEQTLAEALQLRKKAPKPDRDIEQCRGIAQLLLARWPGLAPGIDPAARPRPSFLIESRFRATSPVADGRIDADEYGPDVEVSFDGDSNPGRMFLWYRSRSKAPDDLSARIHTAYTDRSLFLAFQVRDQFVDAGEIDAKTPYTNDAVEVFINGDLTANDLTPVDPIVDLPRNREGFQLIADAGGHQQTLGADFSNADWRVGTSRTRDGYIIEFEIPLALIDTKDGPQYVPARGGDKLLVNFGFVDMDQELSVQTDQVDYGIFWAEDPALSPVFGGEDFWTVSLRLVPKPTSSPRSAARR